MHLRLCIWPSQNPQDIVVAPALVNWAEGFHFGVALEKSEWKGAEQDIHSLHSELEPIGSSNVIWKGDGGYQQQRRGNHGVRDR